MASPFNVELELDEPPADAQARAVARDRHPLASDVEHWSEALGA